MTSPNDDRGNLDSSNASLFVIMKYSQCSCTVIEQLSHSQESIIAFTEIVYNLLIQIR